MIVGVLGILKAGGAYVPLIPDNPKDRLAHQLSETKAPALITEKKFLASLPQFSGKTICFAAQCKSLTEIRAAHPEYLAINAQSAQVTPKRPALAFDAFFGRVKDVHAGCGVAERQVEAVRDRHDVRPR